MSSPGKSIHPAEDTSALEFIDNDESVLEYEYCEKDLRGQGMELDEYFRIEDDPSEYRGKIPSNSDAYVMPKSYISSKYESDTMKTHVKMSIPGGIDFSKIR